MARLTVVSYDRDGVIDLLDVSFEENSVGRPKLRLDGLQVTDALTSEHQYAFATAVRGLSDSDTLEGVEHRVVKPGFCEDEDVRLRLCHEFDHLLLLCSVLERANVQSCYFQGKTIGFTIFQTFFVMVSSVFVGVHGIIGCSVIAPVVYS